MRAFFAHARLGLLLAAVSVPLYALDQATKWWAHYKILDPIAVIPGYFHLVYWTNTGAAFGLGKDNNTFFIVLSAVAAGLIWALHHAKLLGGAWQRWGVALLLPGLFGNLTDRLWHGHVIDFLLFHLGDNGPAWPRLQRGRLLHLRGRRLLRVGQPARTARRVRRPLGGRGEGGAGGVKARP